MGWMNYHHHCFHIGEFEFELPDETGSYAGSKRLDERIFTLASLFKEGLTFQYTYDLGDNWKHKVSVENICEAEVYRFLPACIGGENACPPEDSGGVVEYANLVSILDNPSHEDFVQVSKWAADFKPNEFSASLATNLIHAIIRIHELQSDGAA
jgi:hypothetical protein